jgi:hypothetical protein
MASHRRRLLFCNLSNFLKRKLLSACKHIYLKFIQIRLFFFKLRIIWFIQGDGTCILIYTYTGNSYFLFIAGLLDSRGDSSSLFILVQCSSNSFSYSFNADRIENFENFVAGLGEFLLRVFLSQKRFQ